MASPEKSEKSVLIVDGNRLDGQLAGVILERFGSGYKCEIAITRRQAADALAKRAYDLVLLDTDIQERLDGLKLVQLILMREGSRSKDSAPLTVLFSSKPDRETVQRGVSLGITDFIAKPYPPQSLLQRIEKAMQARGEMTEKNFADSLTQALKQISHIPTLSAVFAKVQALLTAPEPSVEEVSRVIESDPAITMRVLRLANSAYFGFTKTVQTVKHAISLLGFQTIRTVVLAASTFEALGKATDSAGLDRKGLWQHAMGCGEVASFLATKRNLPKNNEGFVGGLLHDVGKIVFDTFFSEYYIPVLEAVSSREAAIVDVEREILGLTHAEVGMQLSSIWGLPTELANIIGYHHRPMDAPQEVRAVTAIVNIADALCRRLMIGRAGDDLMPPIADDLLEFLEIEPDTLAGWLPEIQERAEKAVALLAAV